MLLLVLNWTLALIAIVTASAFGGKIERLGALLLLVMFLVTVGGRLAFDRVFNVVDIVATAEDLLAFLGFSLLGIYSKRVWPLWAAAFQLLSVGAHVVRACEIAVRPIVYAWMTSGPTWAVFILLIIGTVGHHRRMQRAASADSWPG